MPPRLDHVRHHLVGAPLAGSRRIVEARCRHGGGRRSQLSHRLLDLADQLLRRELRALGREVTADAEHLLAGHGRIPASSRASATHARVSYVLARRCLFVARLPTLYISKSSWREPKESQAYSQASLSRRNRSVAPSSRETKYRCKCGPISGLCRSAWPGAISRPGPHSSRMFCSRVG